MRIGQPVAPPQSGNRDGPRLAAFPVICAASLITLTAAATVKRIGQKSDTHLRGAQGVLSVPPTPGNPRRPHAAFSHDREPKPSPVACARQRFLPFLPGCRGRRDSQVLKLPTRETEDLRPTAATVHTRERRVKRPRGPSLTPPVPSDGFYLASPETLWVTSARKWVYCATSGREPRCEPRRRRNGGSSAGTTPTCYGPGMAPRGPVRAARFAPVDGVGSVNPHVYKAFARSHIRAAYGDHTSLTKGRRDYRPEGVNPVYPTKEKAKKRCHLRAHRGHDRDAHPQPA